MLLLPAVRRASCRQTLSLHSQLSPTPASCFSPLLSLPSFPSEPTSVVLAYRPLVVVRGAVGGFTRGAGGGLLWWVSYSFRGGELVGDLLKGARRNCRRFTLIFFYSLLLCYSRVVICINSIFRMSVPSAGWVTHTVASSSLTSFGLIGWLLLWPARSLIHLREWFLAPQVVVWESLVIA